MIANGLSVIKFNDSPSQKTLSGKLLATFALAFFSFALLLFGYLSDSNAIRILGCVAYFSLVLFSDIDTSMVVLLVFAPNMAIITFSRDGFGLYGFGYILAFAKLLLTKRIKIPRLALMSAIIVLIFGLWRIISNKNFYDFAIFSVVVCSVFTWILYYNLSKTINYSALYKGFLFGCVLLFANILVSVITGNCLPARWSALNDDPNYTGCTLCVLLMTTLIVFCYRLPSKFNFVMMVLCSLFGLMTGSRGFLLATIFGLAVFLTASIFGKKEKKVVLLILLGLLVIIVMYYLKVAFVVSVYDATIGRTFNLNQGYGASAYMDATSGRVFLWNYYWEMIKNNKATFFFGNGFYNYHLIENGGYGQVAHNAYISSIIGLGLVGSIALLLLYFSMVRSNFYLNRTREHRVFLTILLVVLVELFFLDGILDARVVAFLATFISLFHIYLGKNNRQRASQH